MAISLLAGAAEGSTMPLHALHRWEAARRAAYQDATLTRAEVEELVCAAGGEAVALQAYMEVSRQKFPRELMSASKNARMPQIIGGRLVAATGSKNTKFIYNPADNAFCVGLSVSRRGEHSDHWAAWALANQLRASIPPRFAQRVMCYLMAGGLSLEEVVEYSKLSLAEARQHWDQIMQIGVGANGHPPGSDLAAYRLAYLVASGQR